TEMGAALPILRASPQLLRLSLLVVLAAVAGALLDYVFKAGAPRQGSLLGFFAVYYTATGVATIVLQAALGRLVMGLLGPAAALGALPAVAAASAGVAALVPGALARLIARGAENLVRSSFFRSGSELLFAPMPERDKRGTKVLIDVGMDRVGDVTG